MPAIVLAVSFATLWKLQIKLRRSQNMNRQSLQTRIISRTILSKILVLTSMKLRNSMPRVEVSLLWQMIIPQCLMKNCSDILMYHSQLQKRFPTLHSRAMILVFTKPDNRGIYYDGNFIEFRNSGGTQDINIVLSKVFKHTSDVFDLSADELQFTEINGRELAVFHYTNENGTDCYYAEFLQNDVAFVVSSENISMEVMRNACKS